MLKLKKIYCITMYIHILQSMMYKKVMDSQVRNTLANELMMYHMKVLYMSLCGD